MRVLIQRVSESAVTVDGGVVGEIDQGLLVLVGFDKQDDAMVVDKMLEKILSYRVFADSEGKMNLSVRDIKGGILLVSQFTLSANTQKGLRPSFSSAAGPEHAGHLYQIAKQKLQQLHHQSAFGIFAADMQVSLTNDGPVTFLLEM